MQILFAATFSVARMVGGPYLTYVTLTADYPILIKVFCSHAPKDQINKPCPYRTQIATTSPTISTLPS
jgi:hypothetical protein